MHYLPHFKKDKKLYRILSKQEAWVLLQRKNLYLFLCKAIISQQLSTKVADVIYKRFLALFGPKTPSPKMILAMPIEELRSIGLSNAKAGYVRNVC
ncbi:MAG: DNA-3-methyladenine glycosylase 2 family protein, partial [Ferruginibacter sp.]